MLMSNTRNTRWNLIGVPVFCGMVAMLCLGVVGTAVALDPSFDAIKLNDGELPGYNIGWVESAINGWWVTFDFATSSGDVEQFMRNYEPRSQYPCQSQHWYKQSAPGAEERKWDYLRIRYGVFDSPSQALSALKAHLNGISAVSFPTAVLIGDYSYTTGGNVSFVRNNVLIDILFDMSMDIDSPGLKNLADMLIARIDANPSHTTITTRGLINDLHILEFMGYIDKNSGIVNSLQVKIEAAASALARGDKTGAANALNVFVNDVNAFIHEVTAQTGKAIEPAAARALISEANALIASIQGS